MIAVAERDYTAIYDKMTSIGPLLEKVGMLTKGVAYDVKREMDILRQRNGVARGGAGDGQPRVETDIQMADAILHLAGVSNGHLATQGFEFLEKRTGTRLADLSAEHEGKQITFADTQVAPVPVITSPEWSGSESRRSSLRAVHDQHRAAQAVPHPDRPPAVLRRPRLADRHGRGVAGLPATTEHVPPLR